MRVSYPSSRRMPEIRSRISSSSSTTRISDAISDPFLLIFSTFLTQTLLYQGEGQTYFGALPVAGIRQHDFAAMVFHDLAHDRQTQPRALSAGGDIGFGESVAMFG